MRFAGMKIASQRYLKDLCKVCLIERGNDDALPVFYCWRNLVVGRVDSVMEVHVGYSAIGFGVVFRRDYDVCVFLEAFKTYSYNIIVTVFVVVDTFECR